MDKKYLVITGASSGIGFATAELFVKNKWTVVNISRSPCRIRQVINIISDLSCLDSAQYITQKLNQIIPSKAIICTTHNAALYNKDSLQSLDMKKLRLIIEANLISPLAINQYLLPKMSFGSSILYIGSTLSEKAVKGAASYVISKHASISMMRITCQDLANSGIHTACICPGFTNTEMLRKHLNNKKSIHEASKKSCFNRLIEPNEIANIIFFAANNSSINGSTLHANLGQIED